MKCLVLYSDGLDSRLVLKLMKKKGFQVYALYVKLPFSQDLEDSSRKFCKKHDVRFLMLDATKGKLLKDYLKVLRKPVFQRGKGMNPCVDCKIFLFKLAKKVARENKIEIIVSGEVLGERPLSQMKKSFEKIEDKSGLKGKVFRPLSAKVLDETIYEKKGLIQSEDFYGIEGRKRDVQIKLAKDFGIDYAQPSGGCLLCEVCFKKRFKFLIQRGLGEKEIKLLNIGRHFLIDNVWVVIGRNEKENKFLEEFKGGFGLIKPVYPAPSALIVDRSGKTKEEVFDFEVVISELIRAYSKRGSLEERKKFERFIL